VTLAPYAMGKRIDTNLISTSRTLDILTTFFWSQGELKRAEATDLLTYEMSKVN